MIVLLTGATGFIGSHLVVALRKAGHEVIAAGRNDVPGTKTIRADFTLDTDAAAWTARLKNVDAVINAVGILRESGTQSFENTHSRTPTALFDACVQSGVKRVIQISALGADTGTTSYFRSKHTADAHLASLNLNWTIIQPSIVYGPGGTSARLFTMLASLPVIGLPGDGKQAVQPIHIDDLCTSIVRALTLAETFRRTVPLVGPEPLAYREFLARLRMQMDLGKAHFMPIPRALMQFGASIAQHMPGSLLDRETLTMLEAGNTADPELTTKLLGQPPRSVDQFIERDTRNEARHSAQLQWLLPILRLSIAAVWLWTAAVSFGLYPTQASYELLRRVGAPEELFALLLYGAATLDLLLGLGTLLLRKRRWLWIAQIVLILGYTVLITWRLPEFWLHPYGPILKNLPMLAGIYVLFVLERDRDGK
ncbi:MAG TPA: NAD(P)H-binding protein [Steroidobacteraceae bacterium]|nr:NAD(P)H-binding protein [Steroidobacteraceae bacterium]